MTRGRRRGEVGGGSGDDWGTESGSKHDAAGSWGVPVRGWLGLPVPRMSGAGL